MNPLHAVICSLLSIHLAFAAMCSNTALTDADRATITNKHNALRSSLALGTARTNYGNAPAGSNIYKLQWDCTIEASAQAWANQCRFDHSDPARISQNLGENLAMSYVTTTSAQLIEAADMWWNEILNYRITSASVIMTDALFNTGVGDFTQMAWGKTTNLGCGVRVCGTYRITVCRYSPPGNYMGQPVYQLGAACRQNSDCTTYPGSTCSVSEGLCVRPGYVAVPSGGTGSNPTSTSDCNGSDILMYNPTMPLSCPTLGTGQCPSPYSYCVYSPSRGYNVCCRMNIGK